MNELDTELDEYYWKTKVKKVVVVSKEYEYPDYNEEFWNTQVAGVISLIMDIYKDKKRLEKIIENLNKQYSNK